MSQDITIFGTYWPFMRVGAQTSEASGSLWNQLLDQYLQPNGLQENPREYVEGQISQQMVRRLGKERNTCALIGDCKNREPGQSSWISCVAKDGSPSCIRPREAPTSTQLGLSGEAQGGERVQIMRSFTVHQNNFSHRAERMYWRDCRNYRMVIIYWVLRFMSRTGPSQQL